MSLLWRQQYCSMVNNFQIPELLCTSYSTEPSSYSISTSVSISSTPNRMMYCMPCCPRLFSFWDGKLWRQLKVRLQWKLLHFCGFVNCSRVLISYFSQKGIEGNVFRQRKICSVALNGQVDNFRGRKMVFFFMAALCFFFLRLTPNDLFSWFNNFPLTLQVWKNAPMLFLALIADVWAFVIVVGATAIAVVVCACCVVAAPPVGHVAAMF